MRHYKKISIRKRNTKRGTKNKSRKQSLWKMKGCAKFANMTGGCGTCGVQANNVMMGGGCGCGAQVNNMMMGGGVCAHDILAYSPDYKYNCVNNLAFTGTGGKGKRGGSNFLYEKRNKSQSQFIDDNLLMLLGGSGTCNGDNMPSSGLYPGGVMGYPWTSNPSSWPGVAGVQGASNYLAYNNYSYPQADRMLENTEAIPFTYGGKSKKRTFRKHMRKHNNKSNKSNKNKKYQKGGLPSLGILTDVKNTWNTLRGNNQLPSPLPFNDQLVNQQEALNM
jgi:hypothetical protein